MRTDSFDSGSIDRPGYGAFEPGNQVANRPYPFLALAPVARDILASADRLPDADLLRVAGTLRSLADEVMAVVNRRLGAHPRPRLVVDNTRRN